MRFVLNKYLIGFLVSFTLSKVTGQANLDSLVSKNHYPFELKEEGILGSGAGMLLDSAKKAEIFMFGENHGIREIAWLANIIYEELAIEQPRIVATEIGPYTAAEVEELIQLDKYEEFMDSWVNLHSVPFFFLKEEVPLIKTAIQKLPQNNPVIWGLDQEFVAGGSICLRHLEKLATTPEEKKAIKKAYRAYYLNPFFIGMGSGDALKKLQEAFKNSESKEARKLTEQLILSHKIYKEQMGGDSRWSNQRREELMMENFLTYTEAIDSIPNMFLKFGAYHLHRGKSPSVKEALGLKITNWGREKGMNTMNVFIDAVQGETRDALMGGETPLQSTEVWEASPFRKYVDKPALFDLRPLRGHPDLENMNYRIRYMIAGYDYLILLPHATPATFMDGSLATHTYGIIILTIILTILGVIIYFIIKFVKRKRRKRKNTLI
ncbi:hypothetical protein [Ekhidna sp.]